MAAIAINSIDLRQAEKVSFVSLLGMFIQYTLQIWLEIMPSCPKKLGSCQFL
jgi:hypothetical protein